MQISLELISEAENEHTDVGYEQQKWEVFNLKDISIKVTDGEHATPKRSDSGYYLLSARNVQDGFISLDDVDFVDEHEYNRIKRRCNPEVGDLLISCSGSIGRVALVPDGLQCVLVRSAALVKPNSDKIDSSFLMYTLQSPSLQNQIKKLLNQGAQANLFINHIEKLKIPVPPLFEQRTIASILSTWDKGIEKMQQLITAKQKRRKILMQQLLTGKKRFKEFTNDWQEVMYGEILKKVSRPIVWDDEEMYNLISVRRRSGGLFHRESLYGRQILTKSLFTAKKGDFLISKMQILHGASGLTTEEFDGMKISGSYISVVAKNPKQLDIEFFSWLAKLPYFYYQTYIASYGVHIEKMTFDFKTFLKLHTYLPSLEEQNKIVSVLNVVDKEIETLQQKLNTLKQQKKGLMQKLLTGQVRVKKEVIENAS